ncbi:JAB1/Mov34/MPN/PAD-1 ubiquitin protease [Helicosporidium sp. ATCC 50920]|nr:JAB1/Mov34/MPN/PAD-1 ubiquitin protease [Helicosporidium sp. ATCC 50920]|eukprot:KDD75404.1 JAB1/Mov34/MPN/PAD-1 ubiquitin protease [Helicosporidium sp. ATCC 50920]
MDRLQRLYGQSLVGGGATPSDTPQQDTSEQIYISSLALLKMLKHGRAGVPLEVMGLMLGEFVDEYTVKVVDVFAMPQSGTGVSVEAVDPAFQTKMLDMLKQVGRPEMVVGWYHSHPGFGCWLSGVDVNTQQSFEALNQRAVAVVIDPIQSVRGKALIHGLNRHYYSIAINYRKSSLEEKMLLNLQKNNWTKGLSMRDFEVHSRRNEKLLKDIGDLTEKYGTMVAEEREIPLDRRTVSKAGKVDAKKRLDDATQDLLTANIVQTMSSMLDTVVF